MAPGAGNQSKKILQVLQRECLNPPPVWFMRQAGRYLPEYRKVREEAGSFLDLCYNPPLAAEVTLQPVRRYDVDAAILFSDILVIPHALGQSLSFVAGEGPRLDPPVSASDLEGMAARDIHETLSPVYETVRRVRADLAPEKTLIGFAGAPWTVATYMLAGGPQKDPVALRARHYQDAGFMGDLINLIETRTIDYLIAQIDAGADALQLFDTWAGGLPEEALRTLSVEPLRRIAAAVKSARPGVPVILFPKGVGPMLKAYAALTECDGVGIDYGMPWDYARAEIAPLTAVQGGLDPLLVAAGGKPMEEAARRLVETFRGTPYIFNLGHGFVPETNPDHVARLMAVIREERG